VLVPGVVGAIALLLALYAMQVLPVNYAGVALIVLGVALISAEAFLPSFGALGIGGVVALVAGSVMLFDGTAPGYGLPLTTIAGVGVLSAAAFLATALLAVRARRRPVVTGLAELLGQRAVALSDFDRFGRVHIRGETWQADSAAPVRAGQSLEVTGLDGLVLKVRP
jgi:membrane-bound serine protease (ClpP class)